MRSAHAQKVVSGRSVDRTSLKDDRLNESQLRPMGADDSGSYSGHGRCTTRRRVPPLVVGGRELRPRGEPSREMR